MGDMFCVELRWNTRGFYQTKFYIFLENLAVKVSGDKYPWDAEILKPLWHMDNEGYKEWINKEKDFLERLRCRARIIRDDVIILTKEFLEANGFDKYLIGVSYVKYKRVGERDSYIASYDYVTDKQLEYINKFWEYYKYLYEPLKERLDKELVILAEIVEDEEFKDEILRATKIDIEQDVEVTRVFTKMREKHEKRELKINRAKFIQAAMSDVFSIVKLSNPFYRLYRNLYDELIGSVDKVFGRLVFG